MKVYAFDVDHTLELSAGPVRFADVVKLREDGHIVGICGNWGAVTRFVGGWHNLFSFIGPIGSTKADMLVQLATYIPAEEREQHEGRLRWAGVLAGEVLDRR